MWFEILPSIGVIFTAMTLGLYSGNVVHATFHEKPFAKAFWTNPNVQNYLRDERITGDAYVPMGLEAIPDEEPTEKKAS